MGVKEILLQRKDPSTIELDRENRLIRLTKAKPLYIEVQEVICPDKKTDCNKRTVKGIFDTGGEITSVRARIHSLGLPSGSWNSSPYIASSYPYVATRMSLKPQTPLGSNNSWWGGNHYVLNDNGNIRYNSAFDKYDVFWSSADGAVVDSETGQTTFPSMRYDRNTHDPPYYPLETVAGYYSNRSLPGQHGWDDFKQSEWFTGTIDQENETFQIDVELLQYGISGGDYRWRGQGPQVDRFNTTDTADTRVQFLELEINGTERPPTEEEEKEGETAPQTTGRRAYLLWALPLSTPREGFYAHETVPEYIPAESPHQCSCGPGCYGCCFDIPPRGGSDGWTYVEQKRITREFQAVQYRNAKYWEYPSNPYYNVQREHDFREGDNVLALPLKLNSLSQIKHLFSTAVDYSAGGYDSGSQYAGILPPASEWGVLQVNMSGAILSSDGYFLILEDPIPMTPGAVDWFVYMVLDLNYNDYNFGTILDPGEDPDEQRYWTINGGSKDYAHLLNRSWLSSSYTTMCPGCSEICYTGGINFGYPPPTRFPYFFSMDLPGDFSNGCYKTRDAGYWGCTNHRLGSDGLSYFRTDVYDHPNSGDLEVVEGREFFQAPCLGGYFNGGYNGSETGITYQINQFYTIGPGRIPARSSNNLQVVTVFAKSSPSIPGGGRGIGYTAGDLIFEDWPIGGKPSEIPTGYYTVNAVGTIKDIIVTYKGRFLNPGIKVRPQPGGNYAYLECQLACWLRVPQFSNQFFYKLERMENIDP